MRGHNASLPADVAMRVERATLKRRKFSAFDGTIIVIWISVSLFFFFSGGRATSPQEIKVVMSVGLLLIVYGLVWAIWMPWKKLRERI
jgi:membrane protein DedA with SNARE-associated domain